MDIEGKHDREYMLEIMTQAHMAGQMDYGCASPGYSNARADCNKILDEMYSKRSEEKWSKHLPDKPGWYWVMTEDGIEHPAKYDSPNGGMFARWTANHENITNKVIAYKKCPGSHCVVTSSTERAS
jgi:protease II